MGEEEGTPWSCAGHTGEAVCGSPAPSSPGVETLVLLELRAHLSRVRNNGYAAWLCLLITINVPAKAEGGLSTLLQTGLRTAIANSLIPCQALRQLLLGVVLDPDAICNF